jgi:hypothetical protein
VVEALFNWRALRYVVAEHDEVNILENQVEQDGLNVLMRFSQSRRI